MPYNIEESNISAVSEVSLEYGSKEVNGITFNVIGAAMDVYNAMGKGFSEAVYKECLSIEFNKRKIKFARETKYELEYKGIKLSQYYYSDFVIEDKIIAEIKAIKGLLDEHSKQVLNYLAASKCQYGLIFNFGENSLIYKRLILPK